MNLFENFLIDEANPDKPVRGSYVEPKTKLPEVEEMLGSRKSKEETTLGYPQLIDLKQSSAIKKRFEEECELEYKEAKRKQVTQSSKIDLKVHWPHP